MQAMRDPERDAHGKKVDPNVTRTGGHRLFTLDSPTLSSLPDSEGRTASHLPRTPTTAPALTLLLPPTPPPTERERGGA